jgi:mono/diheme cytochrome c family protein
MFKTMNKKLVMYLFFIAVAGFSCTEKTENLVLAPGGETNEPVEAVSFTNDVQPIFNGTCTNCHGGSGGVSLTSYAALMNSVGNNYGENVVVPGNADASGLVDKIEPNPQHGNRMPTGGALSPVEIQTIRTWINEGALNN